MDENKSDANMLAEAARDDLSDQGVGSVQEVGTKSDRLDMWRMGKKQEFRRGFRFLSIFGFIMVLMATWEAQLKWVTQPYLSSCWADANRVRP